MKKEKAKKLDEILNVLNGKNWKSIKDISQAIGETVYRSDMYTIRTFKYDGEKIARSRLEGRRRLYILTVSGLAFKNDEGFKKHRREQSINVKFNYINLFATLFLALIAGLSFCKSCKQESKYNELEKRNNIVEQRLDSLEQRIND